jgi:hypothetical protein
MGDAMAQCACGSMMRRHRVVAVFILAIMGLAVLVIATGAVLGLITFFRPI